MGNRTRRKLPPGPSPESWTASFKSYSRDPLSFMPQLVRDYGDIVTMRTQLLGEGAAAERESP